MLVFWGFILFCFLLCFLVFGGGFCLLGVELFVFCGLFLGGWFLGWIFFFGFEVFAWDTLTVLTLGTQ